MKKYMKFMAIALAAMIALASCSEEKKRKALLPNISGKAGEVIVVIDKGNWEAGPFFSFPRCMMRGLSLPQAQWP